MTTTTALPIETHLARIEELLALLVERVTAASPPPSQVSAPSPYLDVRQVAEYLHTTTQGVYALVQRGKITPMPGTRRLLFRSEDLDRYLKSRPRR